jgi:hypothetical protein
MKYARCSKCKNYFLTSHLIKVECNSCDYRTWRCTDDTCGGQYGAIRSILCHFYWWRGRGEGKGGHGRAGLLAAIITLKERIRARMKLGLKAA